MRIDAEIDNHNPVPLQPLAGLLLALERSGKDQVMLYLGDVQYSKGDFIHERGWVIWRRGHLFIDPFGQYFWLDEIVIEKCTARLIQPGEVMHLYFHGETLEDQAEEDPGADPRLLLE